MRIAIACCALVACKGSERNEDQRKPAQAPVAPEAPADAAVPDAAVAPCFQLPFDMAAEKAGIRRLAHRASQAPARAKPPPGVVLLPVGIKTVVPALKGREALGVPEIGADALVSMATFEKDVVRLTAPAHLEGAVIAMTGAAITARGAGPKKSVLVAIGESGLATLARYRADYVKPRIAKSPTDGGDTIDELYPQAIFHDDIDGDGTVELVAYSALGFAQRGTGAGLQLMRGNEYEVGVLWSDGSFAFGSVCCGLDASPVVFLAPPSLSGGAPLLFTLTGDRFALRPKALEKLPPETGGKMTGPRASAPKPMCLQTSASEPAKLVGLP